MSYCAYELNIPNIELVKKEWLKYSEKLEATWVGSNYFDYREIGEHTINLFENVFGKNLLNSMRIMKVSPNTFWNRHVDLARGLDLSEEIGEFEQRHATINILLNEPQPIKTQWWTDLNAIKHYAESHHSYTRKENWKLIDEVVIKERPILINTGQWHSVNIEKERIMAGLHFPPMTSWITAVEYCRHKGFLIER